jgi:UDP-N-acetylmuramoyl-L-alanyl-D-glutamate--2,6-diaminopimelate ligase
VVAFLRQVWTRLGRRAASIGTLGVAGPGVDSSGSLTTPDPVELHRTLESLAEAGITHAAVEASSHGLDQRRLDGVRLTAGAFTNLSRDHLDYHRDLEAYLQAKLRLFETLLPPGSGAVVAADHGHAETVLAVARRRGLRVLTVGRGGKDIRLAETEVEGFAQNLLVEHAGKTFRIRLPLVGEFQVENALVAAGLLIAAGEDAPSVFAALETLEGAKGRLELVGRKDGAPIFVDYAHKPDALAKALEALRPYVKHRLVLVFGAGGDRDQGKRPLMGAIAAQKADRVIVTDDNPRSEDPAAIRAAILAAAPGALEIGDRREAIRRAVSEMKPGDVLLIAGKGHESGQIVGNRVLPFTDHEAVATALEEKVA